MANVVATAKALLTPTTLTTFKMLKEVVETIPELQEPHPKLDAAIKEMLAVARKELDDTAEAAEELHKVVNSIGGLNLALSNATEEETVDSVLALVITGMVTQRLLKA